MENKKSRQKDEIALLSNATNVLDLPENVLLAIFTLSSKRSVLNLAQTCKKFNRLAEDPSLWRSFDFSSGESAHSMLSNDRRLRHAHEITFAKRLTVTLTKRIFRLCQNLRSLLSEGIPLTLEMPLPTSLTRLGRIDSRAALLPAERTQLQHLSIQGNFIDIGARVVDLDY